MKEDLLRRAETQDGVTGLLSTRDGRNTLCLEWLSQGMRHTNGLQLGMNGRVLDVYPMLDSCGLLNRKRIVMLEQALAAWQITGQKRLELSGRVEVGHVRVG